MILFFLLWLSAVDDLGQQISLDRPAQRIITLSPHATELIIALQAEERLLAVANFWAYPASIDHLPRINTWGGLDREQLILWQPDLILAWGSGSRRADLDWLRQQGMAVFVLEPQGLEQIASAFVRLGILLGRPEIGQQKKRGFISAIQAACPEKYAGAYYYDIWPQPLMSLGGRHWLNEVLAMTGLHNALGWIPRAVIQISPEILLGADFDWLFSSQPQQLPAWLQAHKTLIKISPDLGRPGPSLVNGLQQLCAAIKKARRSGLDDEESN